MIYGTMTRPTSGLDMNQLNELLGGFKSDIMSGIDERFSSFQPAPAYEPADYSGQFGGLEEKIAGLERQLGSMSQPAAVDYDRISSIIGDQIGGLSQPSGPLEVDLSPLQGDIAGLRDQFDTFRNNDRSDELIGEFGSIKDMIAGINTQPDMSPITNRMDMGFNDIRESLTRPDPFSDVMDQITRDGSFTWDGQEFDLDGMFGSRRDDYLVPGDPGAGGGGSGGGLDNGWTAPPINPQPLPNPQPAPVQDDMDWNRYGRDYGEVDFNVGGTAGGQGGLPQPGDGGIDLNRMLQNLGLF